MDIAGTPTRQEFKQALREALTGLYDPGSLTPSPLIAWLGLRGESDPPQALLGILLQAIESRRPGSDIPPQSNAWRIYHILRHRYVECFSQSDIAANLSLGTRQLRRLHVLAIDVLGDYLLALYRLPTEQRTPAPPSAPLAQAQPLTAAASDVHEMELLSATPTEATDVAALLAATLSLLEPVTCGNAVTVRTDIPARLPHAAAQRVPVRHAFLSILKTVLRSLPGGELLITGADAGSHVQLALALHPAAGGLHAPALDAEQVKTARQLLRLSGGDLVLTHSQDCQITATMTLPTIANVPVLVVDDNTDALQLFRRYLEGTRYRFIGAADPRQVVALAEESNARLVVLDLMLPQVDGWEVLSRLREHPHTNHIPVIICTILPEEDLALMFGAVGLLRKPVNQPDLLAALDRVLAPPTESH